VNVLGNDPKEFTKKLCDREDSTTNSTGISPEVALYTKSGGFATGSKEKDTSKSDAKNVKKDIKETLVSLYCNRKGHLEEKCWVKHGTPDSTEKDMCSGRFALPAERQPIQGEYEWANTSVMIATRIRIGRKIPQLYLRTWILSRWRGYLSVQVVRERVQAEV
jgi:hypothetical protein